MHWLIVFVLLLCIPGVAYNFGRVLMTLCVLVTVGSLAYLVYDFPPTAPEWLRLVFLGVGVAMFLLWMEVAQTFAWISLIACVAYVLSVAMPHRAGDIRFFGGVLIGGLIVNAIMVRIIGPGWEHRPISLRRSRKPNEVGR